MSEKKSDKAKSSSNKGNNGGRSATPKSQNINPEQVNYQNIQNVHEQQPYTMPGLFVPPYPGSQPTYFPQLPGFRPFSPPTHGQQDGNMYDLMHEMNTRLKTIEITVAKILPLEKGVTSLKCQVHDIQVENKSLSERMTQVEKFCNTYSDVTDDFVAHKKVTQAHMSQLKSRCETIESKMSDVENQNTDLYSKHLEMKTRSMENELIIFGVDEARHQENNTETDDTNKSVVNGESASGTNSDMLVENNRDKTKPTHTREDTEAVLRKALKLHLEDNPLVNNECPVDVSVIQFDKVFRVGNPHKIQENGRPRPIIAKFEQYSSRDKVRRAGLALNRSNKKYKIYEHFPRELEERRKKLYPIARRYGDMDCRVALVRDKLFLNNALYDPDTATFKVNRPISGRPNTRASFSRPRGLAPSPSGYNMGLPPSSSSYNMGPPQRYNMGPPQGYPSYNMGPPPTSRSYNNGPPPSYRSHNTQSQIGDQFKITGFETPNRFSALSDSSKKRPARSPLDMENTAKRPDYTGDLPSVVVGGEHPYPLESLVNDDMMVDPFMSMTPVQIMAHMEASGEPPSTQTENV